MYCMMMKYLISDISGLFKRWFHLRNIIIVSEHKVKHIPMSASLQLGGVVLVLGTLSLLSYSAGNYMAARTALKQQGQALRSVASARVESGFAPLKTASDAPISTGTLSLDNSMLVARIAELETKVAELKNTNEVIVHRVQDKTAGRIDELENIIKQTGLNPENLKKELSENKPEKIAKAPRVNAEGGPYISPSPAGITPQTQEMFSTLDQYAALNQIVRSLPLGKPIKNAEAQSTFGHRIDPFNGHLAFHSGIDLSGPAAAPIYSTAAGKVIAAGRNGAYGNAIDIDHGAGVVTRYGHLSQILVQEGQQVSEGAVIGIQGSTGRATGPHLHYEVRYNDQPMNPKKFLETGAYVLEE